MEPYGGGCVNRDSGCRRSISVGRQFGGEYKVGRWLFFWCGRLKSHVSVIKYLMYGWKKFEGVIGFTLSGL